MRATMNSHTSAGSQGTVHHALTTPVTALPFVLSGAFDVFVAGAFGHTAFDTHAGIHTSLIIVLFFFFCGVVYKCSRHLRDTMLSCCFFC